MVLDASFDDLLPLAFKVMPDSWRESTRDLEASCGFLTATQAAAVLLSFRAFGAVHGATLHEPQQRGPAAEVSSQVDGIGAESVLIGLVPPLPADTKGRSCSLGEPGMRSSPQRKSLIWSPERPVSWPLELLDPHAAFQECGGHHVQPRQQPPAEAAAVQVSLKLLGWM